MEASFTGPLPPPGLLRGYEDVHPGAAERIICMAEKQGEHRRQIEREMTQANIEVMRRSFSEARWGQIFAFSVSLAFLLTGAYVSIHGQPIVGGLWGGVGLGTVVTTFIMGRQKSKEAAPTPPKTQGSSDKKKRR